MVNHVENRGSEDQEEYCNEVVRKELVGPPRAVHREGNNADCRVHNNKDEFRELVPPPVANQMPSPVGSKIAFVVALPPRIES